MITRYVNYDVNGEILGFYSDDLHELSSIPKNSVVISEEDWMECLDNQGQRLIDPLTKKIKSRPPLSKKELMKRAVDEKAKEISNACEAEITSGFQSSALGDTYIYPSKLTDQQNLSASALDSLLNADDPSWTTPFWCEDKNGVWDYRDHTAKQIQQVAKEGKAKILVALAKKKALTDKINAATTIDEVNAVAWS